MKTIKVFEKDNIIFEKEIGGEFQIQFTEPDRARIKRIGFIDNAEFGDKHVIKNYLYRPIAQALIEKFEEISHISVNSILFLENTEWIPGKSTSKKVWIARICKANKYMEETWGYHYIMELKNYYTEKMSREQVIATIYHELRHIDKDYVIKPHDIEDWDNMVATLGKGWAKTKSQIDDLLAIDFPGWDEIGKTGKQASIFENVNVIPIGRASKAVNQDE